MAWAGAALCLSVVALIVVWNQLTTLRFAMNAAWADVDVQLERRHDLVPQLVTAVQGYLNHERGLLDELAARRAAAPAAGTDIVRRGAAEAALSSSLARVIARTEAYPDLKASSVMLRLQEDLTSTERRIARARQRFNETVQDYNIAIGSFPGVVVAALFGMRMRPMFAAGGDVRFAPAVDLADD